ncbi:MAG: NapC/NirT family cytochrome c [Deltaproteobacteria bacterium]|nr:NapC/NirT family cytochrome c [Deltaproteobacteria bacterium]
MRSFFKSLLSNPLSILGVAITTATGLLIITMIVLESLGFVVNPYIGVFTFMVLPAIFVVGLLLIPVGIVWHRRRLRRLAPGEEELDLFPIINLNTTRTRYRAGIVLVLTMVNIVIISAATVQGIHTMDTPEFCGSCHSVMNPEFTTYSNSPHARVACVTCHIGPGADWFVKAKISGSWQLIATTLDLYPRPIPTPVKNLRPARDTCEQCHWPQKFTGDRLKLITSYKDDEANTELTTALLLRVGGIQGRVSRGIHWHVDSRNQIRYLANEKRDKIFDVELTQEDGTKKLFQSKERPEEGAEQEWRVMDCVDCHNRPTHIYRLPEREVYDAVKAEKIPQSLPFVVREGLKAIKTDYPSTEEARTRIAADVEGFYKQNYPDLSASQADQITKAGQTLGDLWARNVFPSMNIKWGTYPSNLGHEHAPGCFRCHDEEHVTTEDEAISQDCDTCHSLLAQEEENPEIVQTLEP